MKIWIPMLALLFAVTGLCVWDGIHTNNVFDHMETESKAITEMILSSEDITDENLIKRVNDLNDYWTKNMDLLCLSISRKDMQPISDYLQYLTSAMINESREDAVTYSRLVDYNIEGLNQTTGISLLNLF